MSRVQVKKDSDLFLISRFTRERNAYLHGFVFYTRRLTKMAKLLSLFDRPVGHTRVSLLPLLCVSRTCYFVRQSKRRPALVSSTVSAVGGSKPRRSNRLQTIGWVH
jgi:hypothetical protein